MVSSSTVIIVAVVGFVIEALLVCTTCVLLYLAFFSKKRKPPMAVKQANPDGGLEKPSKIVIVNPEPDGAQEAMNKLLDEKSQTDQTAPETNEKPVAANANPRMFIGQIPGHSKQATVEATKEQTGQTEQTEGA
ncbi:unnamed protein product, partial [Mesorhabditis spiculigera]